MIITILLNKVRRRWRRDHPIYDGEEMDYRNRWSRLEAHKEFLNGVMEFCVYWFQLICFFYIALHVILMAHAGDSEKSINWALIAIIIKPWGNPVRTP